MAGAEWSDRRIGTLARMAAEHHTAAEVAVQLGISRSAVLGKARRLGIAFGREPAPPQVVMPSGTRLILLPEDAPGEAEPAAIASAEPAPEPEAPAAESAEPAPVVEVEPIPPTPAGWPKPAGPHAVSLMELRDHHCRMPLFAPDERTGLFCGQPVDRPGSSWCAGCRPLIGDRRPSLRGDDASAMRARFSRQSSTGAFA